VAIFLLIFETDVLGVVILEIGWFTLGSDKTYNEDRHAGSKSRVKVVHLVATLARTVCADLDY